MLITHVVCVTKRAFGGPEGPSNKGMGAVPISDWYSGPQKLLVDALSHAIVIQLEGVHFPCMAICSDFRFTSIELYLYDHKSA